MKRLLAASCLTAALVILTGCQPGADTATTGTGSAAVATKNANTTPTTDAPAFTKVTLAVPNMT